jgi:hypothetical protein
VTRDPIFSRCLVTSAPHLHGKPYAPTDLTLRNPSSSPTVVVARPSTGHPAQARPYTHCSGLSPCDGRRGRRGVVVSPRDRPARSLAEEDR